MRKLLLLILLPLASFAQRPDSVKVTTPAAHPLSMSSLSMSGGNASNAYPQFLDLTTGKWIGLATSYQLWLTNNSKVAKADSNVAHGYVGWGYAQNFKLKSDSTANSGYVTHGYLNAHITIDTNNIVHKAGYSNQKITGLLTSNGFNSVNDGSLDTANYNPDGITTNNGFSIQFLPNTRYIAQGHVFKVTNDLTGYNEDLILSSNGGGGFSNYIPQLEVGKAATSHNDVLNRGTADSLYSGGGGTVLSVSGTTNRITSTGGTTPVIDISSTFEGLLLKKSDTTTTVQTIPGLNHRIATYGDTRYLQKANNLSDLGSASTARTNLGLGTLATQSGTFSGTSSGTNTGDQTITLTSDVTGSGTGSFATTIKTNVNLAGSPTTTTQALSDSTTKIATTAFAKQLFASGKIYFNTDFGGTGASGTPISINKDTTATTSSYNAATSGAVFKAVLPKQNALTATAIKTSAYTANAYEFVKANASSTYNVSLPAFPADKTIVEVKMVQQTSTNTIGVVTTDGSTFNLPSGSSSLTLTYLNQAVIVQYDLASVVWNVVADDLGLTALDTRYVPLTRTINGKALSSNQTLGLASSDFANQGTTTTVYHGNAGGNPSFGQIVNADITNSTIDVTSKITGIVPPANLGTGTANSSTILYGDGTYKTAPTGATGANPTVKVSPSFSNGSSTNFLRSDVGLALDTSANYNWSGKHIFSAANVYFTNSTSTTFNFTNQAYFNANQFNFGNNVSTFGRVALDNQFNAGSIGGQTGSSVFSLQASMYISGANASRYSLIQNTASTTVAGKYSLDFFTNATNNFASHDGNVTLRLTQDSLIGIRNRTPAFPLDVNGQINTNSAISAASLSVGLAGQIGITEGTGGRVGQVALVAGTKAITITGLTTSSRAFVTLVTPGNTSLTTTYQAVCTSNTLTLRANVAAGTINVSDTSTLNYFVVN